MAPTWRALGGLPEVLSSVLRTKVTLTLVCAIRSSRINLLHSRQTLRLAWNLTRLSDQGTVGTCLFHLSSAGSQDLPGQNLNSTFLGGNGCEVGEKVVGVGLNLGPNVCESSTALTELSPQPTPRFSLPYSGQHHSAVHSFQFQKTAKMWSLARQWWCTRLRPELRRQKQTDQRV